MSPFSLLLLVGTCSAFLDFGKFGDGVDHWASQTYVFPPPRRSSFQRSPNAQFFHNSGWDLPIRPMLLPQPTFFWNHHSSGSHSAFRVFSDSPLKNTDIADHVGDTISPLLNFFNIFLDSSIDFVLSIEDSSPENDDATIDTEKLDPSIEVDTSQRNVNFDDILDEIFEGDDVEMIDSNVDNFNLTKDMEEDYEDEVIDTAVNGNAILPHFDDILEEIFESPEDGGSTIGTEKPDNSMEEDTSQQNVNFDDILNEIFEGDGIEMMDPNVDVEGDYEDEVLHTAVIENARLPRTHFDDILEEIYENDNNEMLKIKDNDDNEMFYPNVEKQSDFENSNLTKEMKGDYKVLYPQTEIDSGNEMKNARQSEDEPSIITQENIGHEFEPTIILFR